MAVFILRSASHQENAAMQDSADDTLKGRRVEFYVRDIHYPEPLTVLFELHGGDKLAGRIVGTTDSGDQCNAFVVIEVDGLRQQCIVAAKLCLPPK
jgi:hypothetical protein